MVCRFTVSLWTDANNNADEDEEEETNKKEKCENNDNKFMLCWIEDL